jgi:hypothetical protein
MAAKYVSRSIDADTDQQIIKLAQAYGEKTGIKPISFNKFLGVLIEAYKKSKAL